MSSRVLRWREDTHDSEYARSIKFSLMSVINPQGEPSGLPEVGVSSDGTYWKYPDGRLICFHKSTTVSTTSNAIGSSFRSDALAFTFPHAFIEIPTMSFGNEHESSTSSMGIGTSVGPTLTDISLRLNGFVNNTQGYIHYTAIGKWK
jgi:hypothetical protein